MNKEYILQKNEDFKKIIEKNNQVKNKSFIVYYNKNNLEKSRFGISVGKKLGNAVTRNKNKRQIKNIISKSKKYYSKGIDYIIIIRRSAIISSYQDKTNNLLELLNNIDEKI